MKYFGKKDLFLDKARELALKKNLKKRKNTKKVYKKKKYGSPFRQMD